MRKRLSAREKFLLVILIILAVYMAYYYMFYLPTKEKISYYKNEAVAVDDEIIVTEARMIKLARMEKELKDIKAGDASDVKELPQYDNSRNVMNSLAGILENATQYDVSFSGVSQEDGIVRRDIKLNYTCNSYDAVKAILLRIHDGDYRCLIKDLYITQNASVWSVNVEITYFEYM